MSINYKNFDNPDLASIEIEKQLTSFIDSAVTIKPMISIESAIDYQSETISNPDENSEANHV